jgi:Domain of unknown function(DUF2779)
MATVRRFYLTKSAFAKACECPRKLAYTLLGDVYSQPEVTTFQKSLAQSGQVIGLYSRLLFPDGVEIPSSQSVDDQLAQTERWIRNPDISDGAVFEGTVRSGPFWIRADILQKQGSTLHLFEVKAKSFDSRNPLLMTKHGKIQPDFLKYIQDVAFQTFVLKRAFPDYQVLSSLVLPDKASMNTKVPNLKQMFRIDTKSGEISLDDASRKRILEANEYLVTIVPVDDLVKTTLKSKMVLPDDKEVSFEEAVHTFGEVVENANKDGRTALLFPAAPIGRQCSSCEFDTKEEPKKLSGFKQCWKEATNLDNTDDLVTSIYHGGALVHKLLRDGKWTFDLVKVEDFGLRKDGSDPKTKEPGLTRKQKQWLQVSKHPKVVLAYKYLQNEMAAWEYPYHFVDFETGIPVLPYTIGKQPFSIVAYQFSHHVLREDGTIVHASEFLHAEPGVCPNRPFLEALASSLDAGKGTVFRWGSFENTVLSGLKESCNIPPVLESLIAGQERAMVDLMAVFNKGYYAPGSNASSSIKKLLLPTLRASARLKTLYSAPTYNGLNFEAMQWWVESADGDGQPKDPYALIMEDFDKGGGSSVGITQGGDAIVAYDMLQDDRLTPEERSALERGLKRYCELDTLAMVMMVQGLQDFLQIKP